MADFFTHRAILLREDDLGIVIAFGNPSRVQLQFESKLEDLLTEALVFPPRLKLEIPIGDFVRRQLEIQMAKMEPFKEPKETWRRNGKRKARRPR